MDQRPAIHVTMVTSYMAMNTSLVTTESGLEGNQCANVSVFPVFTHTNIPKEFILEEKACLSIQRFQLLFLGH